jgi:cell division transport system ATP-binding protein
MIEFREVSKHYENHTALRNVTFSVQKGELVFITGPSGSGKTTLLKLIYSAEKPDEGRISVAQWNNVERIKNADVPLLRRSIGVVFQDFRLLSNLKVFENIALSLRIRGLNDRDLKARVFDALKIVNLRHRADSYPETLSGGEQQRIAIARAIVSEPTIILADEPTGNVDPETSIGIMNTFKDINARGATILVASHNRELIRQTGRRVLKLQNGDFIGEEIG